MKKTGAIFTILVLIGAFGYVMSRSGRTSSQEEVDCKRIPITSNSEVQPIKELFDPSEPPEEGDFYMLSTETNPWTSTSFDVDGDGEPEEILTTKIAMNHTPHVLRVVKNGYVIFKYEGAGVYAEEVENNNGFILGETIDWNSNQTRQINYEFKDGRFIPIWYQENCYD